MSTYFVGSGKLSWAILDLETRAKESWQDVEECSRNFLLAWRLYQDIHHTGCIDRLAETKLVFGIDAEIYGVGLDRQLDRQEHSDFYEELERRMEWLIVLAISEQRLTYWGKASDSKSVNLSHLLDAA